MVAGVADGAMAVGGEAVAGETVLAVAGGGVTEVAAALAVVVRGARGVGGPRKRRRSWTQRWRITLLVAVAARSKTIVPLGMLAVLPRNSRSWARIST